MTIFIRYFYLYIITIQIKYKDNEILVELGNTNVAGSLHANKIKLILGAKLSSPNLFFKIGMLLIYFGSLPKTWV